MCLPPLRLRSTPPFDAKGDFGPSGQPTTLYVYDLAGNLVRVLNPNGTETDYAIKPVADTQSTTNKFTSSGAILSSYAYTVPARAPASGGWKLDRDRVFS